MKSKGFWAVIGAFFLNILGFMLKTAVIIGAVYILFHLLGAQIDFSLVVKVMP